jgi:hypothetical protein
MYNAWKIDEQSLEVYPPHQLRVVECVVESCV